MSKEVLFRAVSKKGDWIYGFYYCHKGLDEHFILPIVETPFYNGIPIIPKAISDYEVYKETVSEFTGLTDKNGTKIFEGDIIQIPEDWDKYGINAGELFEVYFNYGGFRLKPKIYKDCRGFWLEDDGEFEIISNIHDNPELLEGL